ncbi:cupredoxin domain-containing protein [Paenibacillus chibensis]|uniref:Cupredoxin domain-containing protein n=1 Tax=Paenibacillus chibensis TaxID=59846 RepID=A0ABU6PZZ7_9BACL|nr:cupredoxin domain-containing protein [Paenibacillus chibensis]
MMLHAGSFALILLLTGYHVFLMFRRKGLLSLRNGTILAAVFAVLSGLALGAEGVQAFDFRWVVFAWIAFIAAAAGAALGMAYGWQSALNGFMSAVIGALLGSMLGGLFYESRLVVLAVAVLFIICSFVVQKASEHLVHASHPPMKKSNLINKPSSAVSTIVLAASLAVLAGGMLLLQDRIALGAIGQPKSLAAAIDEDNDMQVATIEVSAAGFTPANTDFEAKKMIKVVVDVKPRAGAGLKLVSQNLNVDADLKEGENIFLLSNPQPGTYDIAIPSKNFNGTLTVKAAH